jgi:2-polyprenyl-6-hydroxyphenyl methylase/3-demethylubiquinone-9 3-methyltransferase
MAVGRFVRRLFGPLETRVANAYRACFFNLDSLAVALPKRATASSILEIGCGEGALTERLSLAYPTASITGIDIASNVGRLYSGRDARVRFLQTTVEGFAETCPHEYDLGVVCDVLHHVPWQSRHRFLRDAKKTVIPGGLLVIKEWEKRKNVPHLFGYISDRYLTGDCVRYETAGALRALIEEIYGQNAIEEELRLPPWSNNLAFLVRMS